MCEKLTELAKLLKRLGLSQTKAALKCSVNPSQFKLYVRGANLHEDTARRIADGLGVKVGELWPEFGESK